MPRCGSGGSGVSGGGGYISPLCCWKGIQWLLGGTRPPYRRFQAYSSSFLFDKPPRIRPISWGIICIHKSSPLTAFHFSILKILHPRPLFFVRLVPPPLPPIEPLGQVFVPGRSYCCVAVTGASPGYKPETQPHCRVYIKYLQPHYTSIEVKLIVSVYGPFDEVAIISALLDFT